LHPSANFCLYHLVFTGFFYNQNSFWQWSCRQTS
jgi:hypothetical protein